MNALLLSYKPPFLSSNAFLAQLKQKYHLKKAGFSGTLDPFAQGSLLVASGAYTKLLRFIPTAPKVYEATLWLGAKSASLDIENMLSIESVPHFSETILRDVLKNLVGSITYTPPSFSAKKVQGKRAYDLARRGETVVLPQESMEVYSIELLCYNHPFVSFRVSVSKGAYIRSLGLLIAEKLGVCGSLSALKRISEGRLCALVGEEIFLQPFDVLPFPVLVLDSSYKHSFYNGVKINLPTTLIQQARYTTPPHCNAQLHKSSIYIVKFDDFFSIIRIESDGNISYLLNRIHYAHTL